MFRYNFCLCLDICLQMQVVSLYNIYIYTQFICLYICIGLYLTIAALCCTFVSKYQYSFLLLLIYIGSTLVSMDQYLFLLSMSGCRTMLMFADANSQTLCLYASYTYISYIYDISLFYNMGSALSLCMNIEYLCLLLISRCRTMPMFADATVSCNKSTRTMAAGPRGGAPPPHWGGGGGSPYVGVGRY